MTGTTGRAGARTMMLAVAKPISRSAMQPASLTAWKTR
jgi:hypothetical protein